MTNRLRLSATTSSERTGRCAISTDFFFPDGTRYLMPTYAAVSRDEARRLCLRRTPSGLRRNRPRRDVNPRRAELRPERFADAGLSRPARHTCSRPENPRACEPGFSEQKVSPREAGPGLRAGFSEQKVSPREARTGPSGLDSRNRRSALASEGPGLPGWIPGTEGQHPAELVPAFRG